ncbi:MAG: single-stranded DNA-binding protein [Prevotellaceae bacterium]|jgi:single-strand DNA-binding protein|nr:single-stranded DNA-binding protein [Prevotellaceae bacterium]
MFQELTVIGNVGKDAEIKTTENSKGIVFSIAVNESYKDKNGEKRETTTWFDASYWKGKDANLEELQKHIKTGTKLFLKGKPQAKAYITKEENGAKASLGIAVNEIVFL